MATLENKGAGMLKRIIRDDIRLNNSFPRIEDLSDLMYDAMCDSSYIRSESAAERIEDGMRQFGRYYENIVCKGTDTELYDFLNNELKISKTLASDLVANRPENLF